MSASLPETAAREAIEWKVLLHSGDADAGDREAFAAWLAHDERHRAAWQRLDAPVAQALAPIRLLNRRVPGQAAALADAMADTQARMDGRRRVLRGALAVAGLGAGAAAVLQRFEPLPDRFADLHTGTGQRQRFDLPDGSSLLLNARSAVDLVSDPDRRTVRLRSGAVIADVPADPPTPFLLLCAQGEVRSLRAAGRARFLVRQKQDASLVVALTAPVEIVPAGGPARRIAVGDAAWLSDQGAHPAPQQAASAAAWASGRVAAYDRPLGEVVDAIRAYRPGLVRISDEAAALKVYGSYPLDDTDRALASIAETLPVVVRVRSGGWLVRIDLA